MDTNHHRFSRWIVNTIDTFSDWTGRTLSWLTLVMMLVTCVVVVLRYVFGIGSLALQESVTYMHCIVFMLCSAFCLQRDGHVRVDIFYRQMSPSQQAWVNSIGSIVFLLPLSGFLFFISWEYVAGSWRIHETSVQADGIPAVYLLKTLIPLMGFLLALQALADTLRSLITLIQEDVQHG